MQEADGFGDREMKVVYFPARYLENLHKKAKRVWYKMPAEYGWYKSKISPMEVLKIFPNIWIREGYVLRAYVYRGNIGGRGIVLAMPEDSEFPDVEELGISKFSEKPEPKNAVPFTEVIEGDSSPESYIQASLFVREMFEFGAFWHGLWWSTHEIIDKKMKEWEDLRWKDVNDLRPRVVFSNNITVEFYTFSMLDFIAVYRNRDVYETGYRFKISQEVVADGGRGFVF